MRSWDARRRQPAEHDQGHGRPGHLAVRSLGDSGPWVQRQCGRRPNAGHAEIDPSIAARSPESGQTLLKMGGKSGADRSEALTSFVSMPISIVATLTMGRGVSGISDTANTGSWADRPGRSGRFVAVRAWAERLSPQNLVRGAPDPIGWVRGPGRHGLSWTSGPAQRKEAEAGGAPARRRQMPPCNGRRSETNS